MKIDRGLVPYIATTCLFCLFAVFSMITANSLRTSNAILKDMEETQAKLTRLQNLIDILPSGIAFVDMATRKPFYINASFEQFMNTPRDIMVNQNIIELVPEAFREAHEELFESPHFWKNVSNQAIMCIPDAYVVDPKTETETHFRLSAMGNRIGERRELLLFIDPTTVRREVDASEVAD